MMGGCSASCCYQRWVGVVAQKLMALGLPALDARLGDLGPVNRPVFAGPLVPDCVADRGGRDLRGSFVIMTPTRRDSPEQWNIAGIPDMHLGWMLRGDFLKAAASRDVPLTRVPGAGRNLVWRRGPR